MTIPAAKPYGFVERFHPGDRERTERSLSDILASRASYLRTDLSSAECLGLAGEAWFDWLIPRLEREIELLPCIHFTTPSLSRPGCSSGPPQDLKSYADFVDHVLTRYGSHFTHFELWNEPSNLLDWNWREDGDFQLFCAMVGGAANRAKDRGWKPILGAPCPFDPHWLNVMGERGVLNVINAVGLHDFPGTWHSEEGTSDDWDRHLGEMRSILDRYNPEAEVWITETGYSTRGDDEIEQARRFRTALSAPAERMYWYSWCDLPSDVPVPEGLSFEPHYYHLGAVKFNHQPKLLARILTEGGADGLEKFMRLAVPNVACKSAPILVTGGCGFVGSNLADSFLQQGEDVVVLDNLCRPGVDQNLAWLIDRYGKRVHPALADVREFAGIEAAFKDAKAVFHFAAQTAVTTSLIHPVDDFEVNARGTVNVLEAVRKAGKKAPVIFASTNKVYGALTDVELLELDDRYVPADDSLRLRGVGEGRPLDFCTPYGCSKGVADQYVLDYAKSYGLPTAVLRMSCIYGPRQFGTEDQGWVAHFLIQALSGEPISIYGNGKQVRDILHVEDAVAAYRAVLENIDRVKGYAFNLGGGPLNAVSILAVLREIEKLTGRPVEIRFDEWRAGDQYYFVADTGRLKGTFGWQASVKWRDGVHHLAEWLAANRFGDQPVLRESRRVSA
jgi:CDP-paratose 2-epimerase